ncbi:MAG: hypothetical protein GY882_13390, partial [Actinomycetia bacterium]|nr:hypothetical protein [Actinomycetes bacterium]
DDPTLGTLLTCTPGAATDADGDDIDFDFGWEVDDVLTGDTGDTLAAPAKDSRVVCLVTPRDAGAIGDTVRSNEVVVDNAAPAVADVTITPDPATVGDTLTCSYVFTDPDGDADASLVEWLVDDAYVAEGPTWDADAAPGSVVTCLVTAFDGDRTGTTAEASLTLDGLDCPSLVFDGTGTFVHMPDEVAWDADLDALTLELWLKGDEPVSTNLIDTACATLGWKEGGWYINTFPGCDLNASPRHTNDGDVYAADWPTGWFHVALVVRSVDTVEIYINGHSIGGPDLYWDGGNAPYINAIGAHPGHEVGEPLAVVYDSRMAG